MVVKGEEEEVIVAQGQGEESWLGLVGLGVPSLPSLSLVAKYSCLLCWTPREKSSVEEEIKEKEEAIRQRSTEVQVRSCCLCLSVFLVQRVKRKRGSYGLTDCFLDFVIGAFYSYIYEHMYIFLLLCPLKK